MSIQKEKTPSGTQEQYKKEGNNEKINPLIEYFYIIGPNPEIIKNNEFYKNIELQEKIDAKILTKFPPVEKYQITLKDEIIISHCFPNGFKIIKSNVKPQKRIFNFSLQNIFPTSKGEELNIYFTCLKFYESLSKYYEIHKKQSHSSNLEKNELVDIDKYQNFGRVKRQTMILNQSTALFINKIQNYEDYYIPKVICFCSNTPFPYEFGYLLNKILNYTIDYGFKLKLDNNENNKKEKLNIIEEENESKNENKNENNKKDNNINDNNKKDDNKLDNNKIDDNKKDNNNTDNKKKDDNKLENNKIDDNKRDNDKIDNNKNNKNDNKKNLNNQMKIPIEKIIEKLVMEIPKPQRGIFYIKFKKDNSFFKDDEKELIIRRKEINSYDCPSYILQSIFLFSTKDIIQIYKFLLLERPILFFSSNIENLTNIYESFISLLYPLKYKCPHVSVLPDINFAIIQNCESFVFGINQSWSNKDKTNNFFDRNNIVIYNKLIIICDIDNKKIGYYCKDLNNRSIVNYINLGKNSATNINLNNNSTKNLNHENKNEYININLPSHYSEKLKKKLDTFLASNKNNLKYYSYNEEYNKQISEDFFYYFLVSILGRYNNYLYNSENEVKKICRYIYSEREDEKDINKIFNVERFLYDSKSSDTNFYTAFLKTKIFMDFIERKYYNKRKDKSTFLIFDENFVKKRNKSIFQRTIETPYINLQMFNIKNIYDISNFNNFNDEEIKYITENKKELLNYYQTYNGKEFNYNIFPKLLYDNKFFNNKKYILNYKYEPTVYTFTKIFNELFNEIILDEEYFKIYSGSLILQYKYDPGNALYDEEIQNSLHLLWLRIFCLTFYYCEKDEKNIRFYEMINIVQRLKYIKDDIFSLILSTLDKYGTDIMMIQFFSILKNYNYIQYSYLSHKLLKEDINNSIIKKMNISNTNLTISYFTENQEEYIIPPINTFDKDKLKQRTFGINNNENINQNENIYFSQNIQCSNCGEKLDISGLTLNYKGMVKSRNLTCQCKKELTNKITIKVNGKYFRIELFEPYYLYRIFSSEILQKYGNQIDLNELRVKYKDFYWNCVWYFSLQGFSYDMLLKYKDDLDLLDEEKERNNKLKEKEKNKLKKRKKKFNCLKICSNNIDNIIK